MNNLAQSESFSNLLEVPINEARETSDDGFFALDREWRFTYVNAAAERMLERTRAELLGAGIWDLYPAVLGTAFEENYRQALDINAEVVFEAHSAYNDRWYEVRAVPSLAGLAVYLRDITADRYTRQALDQILASSLCILWHATVRDPGDGELIWKTQVANEAAAQQYLPLKIVEGERYAQAWYMARPLDDRERADTISTEALLSGASGYRQDYRCVRQDGELRWLSEEVQITRLTPGLWHVIGVCVDVTERKQHQYRLEAAAQRLAEANEQLTALATTDGLTSLSNHRAFHERLTEEFALARKRGASLSLVMFDVDRFKAFNDRFGHPAGDEVLKQLAQLVADKARASDIAARYGGEEFAVILPGADVTGSQEFAECLRLVIADYTWLRRSVTVSLGIATLQADMESPSTLVEEADSALYMAKALGRNRTVHHRFIADQFADKPIQF